MELTEQEQKEVDALLGELANTDDSIKLYAESGADPDVDSFMADWQQDEANPPSFDFNAMDMVKNIPGSAMQLIDDTTYPIRHPFNTLGAIASLAKGGVEKFSPGVQENEATVDAVWNALVERYGGMENLKKTLQEDPVGLLSDVVGITTGGAVIAAKAGGNAAKIANIVGDAAKAIDPINAAVNTTKLALKETPLVKGDLASDLYKQVAKTSFSQKGKRTYADGLPVTPYNNKIEMALDNQIDISRSSGIVDLRQKQADAMVEIDRLIEEANSSGRVPSQSVFDTLKPLRQELGSATQTTGIKNLREIDKVAKDIGQNQRRLGKDYYTVEELHELKKSLWADINFDRGQQTGTRAAEEARKAIGDSAKTKVEHFVPEIKGLNRTWGELEEISGDVERTIRRVEGKDVMGLGTPLKILTAHQIGGEGLMGNVAAIAAGLGQALGTDKHKVRTALALRDMRNRTRMSLINDNSAGAELLREAMKQSGRGGRGYSEDDSILGLLGF
jgi:hypothetical protein